ncbi:NAD-dependent epimerase/dehydratase family protein [Variovorax sp. RB2P76]|uniref:NAD-dependent epimerase/dehydratase family protein n=1 Tax=Variovorax sp. RB2P76 TaxID=3443736 RepID=UPI003F471D89
MTDGLPPVARQDLDEILRLTTPDTWEALRRQSVFITGGTGFVGKWLLEALLHADRSLGLGMGISVLTRSPDAFAVASPHLARASAVELVRGDILDLPQPTRPYTFVIHAALPVATLHDSLANLETLAAAGTQGICRFSAASGARRLLHVSSGAVYPPSDGPAPMPEDRGWPKDPGAANVYARAKRQSEAVVNEGDWPFEAVIARCFAFSGPYLLASSGVALAGFMERAIEGRPLIIQGTGQAVRTYQYASDMARWLLTCLVHGAKGSSYNVGSNEPVTILELARTVGRLAGNVEVRVEGRATEGLAGSFYIPDTQRAQTELGLRNSVGLEDGVQRMLQWRRSKVATSLTSHE